MELQTGLLPFDCDLKGEGLGLAFRLALNKSLVKLKVIQAKTVYDFSIAYHQDSFSWLLEV